MSNSLRIIPLGGLGEIGKNMMAICYQKDIIVIDCGLGFPAEDEYGVDYIIPNYKFLVENKNYIKGIILTHGHEDHIGGINHFLEAISNLTTLPTIYGTKLTIGLTECKISRKLIDRVSLKVIQTRQKINLSSFKIEFLKVCHSIADSIGLVIETPIGNIVHTGDFKFDPTPIDGIVSDYFKFAEIGEKGVLLLMSDSTNVTREGFTPSEKEVSNGLINAIGTAEGRVIVTTFASNIHRVQQIINISHKFNRKVVLLGKSMEKVTKKAIELGYLKCPENILIEESEIDNYKDNELSLLTTGSQGEPMSALTRIANDQHWIKVKKGDKIIISAVPIPGNEKMVFSTINKLFARGAEVVYESYNQLHVSGHASQEELKLMINLTKPKYFVPIHGENRHLIHHRELAKKLNIKEENIFVLNNGDILEVDKIHAEIKGKVPAEKVLVDKQGKIYLEEEVVNERRLIAEDGIIVVTVNIFKNQVLENPNIVSKGFIDTNIFSKISQSLKDRIDNFLSKNKENLNIEKDISNLIKDYITSYTGRKPIVSSIINKIDLKS
ncbi:MAG: ribonuclease J [Candidatus Sericytochromatia bacterium]|nr:MAG: ribonuclease J [Candidatus Sericytochromatia bacterium]